MSFDLNLKEMADLKQKITQSEEFDFTKKEKELMKRLSIMVKAQKDYWKSVGHQMEGKLEEQISSFHTIQRNLIDFGFGNMVVSWRGTKKKVKDFKPGNRIDNITLEKTHNTLLKNKSMRYDGNDYHVTTQGKKYFKGTLQLEGKLKEEIFNEQINPQVTKAVDRFIKTMAKKYGYSDQDAVYAIMQVLTKAGYKGVR